MKEKPGFKTSEYWLSFVAVIVGGLLASGVITNESILQILGYAAAALTVMGYTGARAWTKNTAVKASAIVEAAKLNPSKPQN